MVCKYSTGWVLIKPSWYGNRTVSSLRGSDDWRTELVTVQRNQRFGLKSMRSLYTFPASYVRFHFISNIHFIYFAIAIHNILSIINRYVHTPKYQYVTVYTNPPPTFYTLQKYNTGGSYEKAEKNFPHWTPNGIFVKQFGEKYENDHDIVFSRVREKRGEIIIFVVS